MPLTQQQIDQIPTPFLKKIEALEVDTMTKVADRLKRIGELTPTDLHKLNQLANIGFEVEQFEKQLNVISRESDTEIYTALKKSVDFKGTSQELDDLVKSVWNITQENIVSGAAAFQNISRTAGFVTADGYLYPFSHYYTDLIDKAVLEIRTGVTDFNSAMRSSLRALADRGLSHVSYSGGMVRRADTSIRAAFMGANARLSMQAAEINAARIGADGMEITWHSGFRPSHDFGGKQFTMKEYRNRIEPLMLEFNCYHRAFPILLGVSEPTYSAETLKEMNADEKKTVLFEGVEYNKYDAQQMQRRLETAIRTQKDRALVFKASGDKEAQIHAQTRVTTLNYKYAEFNRAMDIPAKPQRVSVAGYRGRRKKK